ncbi:MAG: hypothetical protein K0R53_3168 [Burkholderiales bacterium]|nr:hypothetical protein [Burkholderiales bacterium]
MDVSRQTRKKRQKRAEEQGRKRRKRCGHGTEIVKAHVYPAYAAQKEAETISETGQGSVPGRTRSLPNDQERGERQYRNDEDGERREAKRRERAERARRVEGGAVNDQAPSGSGCARVLSCFHRPALIMLGTLIFSRASS